MTTRSKLRLQLPRINKYTKNTRSTVATKIKYSHGANT